MRYNYDTGQVSHYVLKRVEHSCHKDADMTRLIGVACKSCPYYEGLANRFIRRRIGEMYPEHADEYVVCTGHERDDEGPNVSGLRAAIYESIYESALNALCY